ncbi:MAG: DotU family type IV/VI secretion system protein, partial [Myxococcota bacterium]
MITTTIEQWFDIERVVTDVHALLAQTRAHVLQSSAWPDTGSGGRDGADPRGDEGWVSERPGSATRFDFIATRAVAADTSTSPSLLPEPLFGRPLAVAEVEVESPPALAPVREVSVDLQPQVASEIADVRMQVRERLTWLRSRLDSGLSSREARSVLYPLVIHIDELAGKALGARVSEWRPLQKDFFDITDGGEEFFARLDELLTKEDTLPLALEVALFCLKDGFVGKYGQYPGKLEDSRRMLGARIPVQDPPMKARRNEASDV